jgi:hypothetical protein
MSEGGMFIERRKQTHQHRRSRENILSILLLSFDSSSLITSIVLRYCFAFSFHFSLRFILLNIIRGVDTHKGEAKKKYFTLNLPLRYANFILSLLLMFMLIEQICQMSNVLVRKKREFFVEKAKITF